MRPLLVRMLAFFLGFAIDVRIVKAEDASRDNKQHNNSKGLLFSPADCADTLEHCSVINPSRTKNEEVDIPSVGQIRIGPQTVLKFTQPALVLLAEGRIWVKVNADSSPLKIQTSEGDVDVAPGEAMLSHSSGKFEVICFGSDVQIDLKEGTGSPSLLSLPNLHHVELRRLRSDGTRARTEPMVPSPEDLMLARLQFFGRSPASVEAATEELRSSWRAAVQLNANYHQQRVARRQTTLRAEKAIQETQAHRVSQRRSELRRLNRERLGISQE